MPLLGVTPSTTMLTPSSATTVMSNLSISGDKTDISGRESKESPNSKHNSEPCSNVVSSTMEDEDSREGILTVKVSDRFDY